MIHGGTEMMRSKGHAPLQEIQKQTESGTIVIHGKRDTYNLRTANAFVWDNVGAGKTDGLANDYQQMIDYWKGLIAFRKSEVGGVFRRGQAPPDGYYAWILPDNPLLLGYVVDDQVLVLINSDEGTDTMSAPLPSGNWLQIADNRSVNHRTGIEGASVIQSSGETVEFEVAGPGLQIWIRQ